ncbi:hypothetical protein CN692_13290 [Bacillus sp. AFS002410]|uniref:hypothetical protein n=1 Tax=Bacillus sp. AFS002410 TaxID=2033481 RepID=UPI000BF1C744|nr:hypothetical protein [Bacillus sp. AFS002410]PEJ57382.1 hypothetical protein CN692_13290 [Bacillus sp. AFS002410]
MAIKGRTGLTNIFNGLADDDFIQVPTFLFNFPFYGTDYNTAYVGSNSYLTFGSSSIAFDGFGFTSQKGLYVQASDRADIWVGYVSTTDYTRIRWEGGTFTDGNYPYDWEVTLFKTGVVQLDIGTLPNDTPNNNFITNGLNDSSAANFTNNVSNRTIRFTPKNTASNGYDILYDAAEYQITNTLFKDTFTDTNGKSLSAHTADVNGTGNPYVLSDFSNGVSSATINASGQGVITNGDSFAVVDVGQADVTIQATLISTGAAQIVFRRNTSAYFYAEFDAGGVSVFNVIPNTNFISMGSASYAGISSGALAKVVLTGSTIDVYMNGTKVLTVTSAVNQTVTSHGIGSGVGNTAFDNLQIDSPAGGGGTIQDVTLSLSANSSFSPIPSTTLSGAINFSGDSSITLPGGIIQSTGLSMSAVSSLMLNSSVITESSINMSSDSSLTAIPSVILDGKITLSGDTTLTIAVGGVVDATISFSSDSNLSVVPSILIDAGAILSAASDMSVNPSLLVGGGIGLIADTQLTVTPDIIGLDIYLVLSATSGMNVVPSVILGSGLNLSADASISVNPSLLANGSTSLSALSNMLINGEGFNPNNVISSYVYLDGSRQLIVQLEGKRKLIINLKAERVQMVKLNGVIH